MATQPADPDRPVLRELSSEWCCGYCGWIFSVRTGWPLGDVVTVKCPGCEAPSYVVSLDRLEPR